MATVDMLTTNTYASEAAMREFENKLGMRLPGATKVVFGTHDAVKKAPVVEIRQGAAVVALVTMAALPTEDHNILGLPQTSYSPHAVKVAFANGDAGAEPAVVGIAAKAKYLILGELFKLATKVEIYEADTATVAEAVFAGTPDVEWYADMYWGPNASV